MSKVWTDSSRAKPHRDAPAAHLEHSVEPHIVSGGWVGRERVWESSVLPLAVGQALLLCCGALSPAGTIEVNADRDERGNSLLLTAAQNGLKRIVKLLLRKGADINARVCGKQPPPCPPPRPPPCPPLFAPHPLPSALGHTCASCGHACPLVPVMHPCLVAMCVYARPLRQNSRGNTCLHYCYAYKFPDLAEYLLSKGADDSILNLDGMTCYEAEVSGGLALNEVDNI